MYTQINHELHHSNYTHHILHAFTLLAPRISKNNNNNHKQKRSTEKQKKNNNKIQQQQHINVCMVLNIYVEYVFIQIYSHQPQRAHILPIIYTLYKITYENVQAEEPRMKRVQAARHSTVHNNHESRSDKIYVVRIVGISD